MPPARRPSARSPAGWLAPGPASTPRPTSDNAALGYTNNTFNGQYTGEVAWLKYWWQKRLEYADSQFTRPAVASVPAGMVTAGTTVTLTSPARAHRGRIFYTTDGTDPRMSGGNAAANATLYTAPIVINGPVKLFVRVRHPAAAKTAADTGVPFGSRWSAPSQFTYTTM